MASFDHLSEGALLRSRNIAGTGKQSVGTITQTEKSKTNCAGVMKIRRITISQIAVLPKIHSLISPFLPNICSAECPFLPNFRFIKSPFLPNFYVRLGFYKVIRRNKFLAKTEIWQIGKSVNMEIWWTRNLTDHEFDEPDIQWVMI